MSLWVIIFNQNQSFLVRAKTETQARNLVLGAWDKTNATCQKLFSHSKTTGKVGLLMSGHWLEVR